MDRIELSYRLRRLGFAKRDLATACGMTLATVYTWGDAGHPVPRYVTSLVEAWELAAASRPAPAAPQAGRERIDE